MKFPSKFGDKFISRHHLLNHTNLEMEKNGG